MHYNEPGQTPRKFAPKRKSKRGPAQWHIFLSSLARLDQDAEGAV